MTFAWTQDVPIDMEIYGRIEAELGEEAAKGLVAHVVTRIPGGLRYLDVWESEEDCDRFFAERVHPAISRVFAAIGFEAPTREPPRTPLDVTRVWTAAGMWAPQPSTG